MMIFQRAKAPLGTEKPAKRSLFGMLFNPQLGSTLTPMRENHRVFVQLVATVFSMYGLFPKDHPGLRDLNVRLSLREIIATAWSRVEFTREALPRTLMFFAVTGIMIVSGFAAIATILSLLGMLFVGKAHAMDTSVFTPPDAQNDLAQAWIDYIFNGSTNYPAVLASPFMGGISLQTALIKALAFYSDAILIIAAVILFYHLASMVVETAHEGVPMGKRASQVWAPIRLVVAIGLLVPVSSGLNCGQFIVIKMAEMGSALASNTWDLFLNELASYNTKLAPVSSSGGSKAIIDIINMEACAQDWNSRINEMSALSIDYSRALIPVGGDDLSLGSSSQAVMNNMPGTKYTFSSNELSGVDICGWFFVPSGDPTNTFSTAAASAQRAGLAAADSYIQRVATAINQLRANDQLTSASANLSLNPDFVNAVMAYQTAVNQQLASSAQSQQADISNAIAKIRPYGWVMAGTFLNTIDRMQADLAAAAADSLPLTSPPPPKADQSEQPNVFQDALNWLLGGNGDPGKVWDIRGNVAMDMNNFYTYEQKSIAYAGGVGAGGSTDNSAAACAAAIGLKGSGNLDFSSFGNFSMNMLFGFVDWLASQDGAWSTANGVPCSSASSDTSPSTFALGIKFNGRDPFAQMSALGHGHLTLASDIITMGISALAVGGGLASVASAGTLSGLIGGLAVVVGSILVFLALIFFVTGFLLAYLIPLMPFLRFFVSVISWMAALVEAIIGIPMVALAHINPQGEGLPGEQARRLYFYIFNIFLRPIMTIFGFVCGLIIFLIALSFLNYAYAIAVTGAGGTAYGHAALSKIIYSALYVIVVYSCANHAFALIDHIPTNALRWLGAEGPSVPQMGNVERMEQLTGVAGGYSGKESIGKVEGAATSVGSKFGGYLKGDDK